MPSHSTNLVRTRRFEIYTVDQSMLPGVDYALVLTNNEVAHLVGYSIVLPLYTSEQLNIVRSSGIQDFYTSVRIPGGPNSLHHFPEDYHVAVCFPQTIARIALLKKHSASLHRDYLANIEALFKAWCGFKLMSSVKR